MKNSAQQLLTAILYICSLLFTQAKEPSQHDIIWNTPSKGANESMPLGNGDIGANVWVEPNGDLLFYISKSDARDTLSNLLKVGKVRVSCDPVLFTPNTKFTQRLDLKSGRIIIETDSAQKTKLIMWADANNPVLHLKHKSEQPVSMTAKVELWRTQPRALHKGGLLRGYQGNPVSDQDTVISGLENQVAWYHHTTKSVGFDYSNEIQGLKEYFKQDPLLHRTFGALIGGTNVERINDTTLKTRPSTTGRFDITVLTKHPSQPDDWLETIKTLAHQTASRSFPEREAAHLAWWSQFWSRSWVNLTQNKISPSPLIPANKHPLQLFVAQNGSSAFDGQHSRVSYLPGIATEAQIKELSSGSREPMTNKQATEANWINLSKDSVSQELNQEHFAKSVSLETWIKPTVNTGRIFDKVASGQTGGFLVDIHPAKGLRFIMGSSTIAKEDCLTPGKWHHVAAVMNADTNLLLLYLDGEEIGRNRVERLGGDEAGLVSLSYTLQRYMNACAGRGKTPIKFNGSLFTAPFNDNPDSRRWGAGYWWQNTRLPYASMCQSGDYDLMQPLFKMYAEDVFELNKFRTQKYLGHGGVFFPECIYFWGSSFTDVYGVKPFTERDDKLQESPWHKWEWVSGLEFSYMMLDYVDHTQDLEFLKNKALPVAIESVRFFDEHYKTNSTGQLVMYPAMACETWWDCTNPMPELAGLHAITSRLLALPSGTLSEADYQMVTTLQNKLAPLPTREVAGKQAYAPAQRFEKLKNIENPELYVTYPFRLCSFEKENVELGKAAFEHRWARGNTGWRQDDIFAAYLGMPEVTRKQLVGRCSIFDANARFPAFWGPNYDWTPDQTHGGVIMKTVQAMIMQPDPYSRKIHLNAALPKSWNCEFKLHAPYKTIVQGTIENGNVTNLKVTPAERRADIVIRK